MRLTERDIEIINYLEKNKGASIDHIKALFFEEASYVRASTRLKLLKQHKYIKCGIQPTIGKLIYYKNKMPSYHNLIWNEIIVVFKDRYINYNNPFRIGNKQVDFGIGLKTGKILLFEIEIFNKVSKTKLDYLESALQGTNTDLWIVNNWHSKTQPSRAEPSRVFKGSIKFDDLKKLGIYY